MRSASARVLFCLCVYIATTLTIPGFEQIIITMSAIELKPGGPTLEVRTAFDMKMVLQLSPPMYSDDLKIRTHLFQEHDKELFDLVQDERRRQRSCLELIASENFTSRAVMVIHHLYSFFLINDNDFTLFHNLPPPDSCRNVWAPHSPTSTLRVPLVVVTMVARRSLIRSNNCAKIVRLLPLISSLKNGLSMSSRTVDPL